MNRVSQENTTLSLGSAEGNSKQVCFSYDHQLHLVLLFQARIKPASFRALQFLVSLSTKNYCNCVQYALSISS